jgi:hypothetical protein
MHKGLFSKYVKSLADVALRGDAREESFYPVLAGMLSDVALATGRKGVHVTTLPKATDAGNPDFRLWNGADRIIGYVEAKKPTEERLDQVENSEQLRRYLSTFPNLILTNFLEFRLYRNGERVETVLAARPVVLNRLKTVPPAEKTDELFALFDRFLDFSLPQVFTAESLAVELAKRTGFLRDVIAAQLIEENEKPGVLTGFYEAFKKYLIGGLTLEEFADLYAQTITYGLFAARTRAGETFNRRAAFDNIPHTIGVLRDLFRFISLGDLPEQLAWCVDDIAEVLAVADAPGILDRYYHEGKGSDPIVHFYETFLAQYDPAERECRGVYYTPEPVVSYIVRSLHQILKTEFGKPDGLASDGVTLLDPAAGTMTFVARAAQEAMREFEAKYGSGGREDFIRRHILKNFYAFELMMAPYAVGHLKMGFFLEELGHRLRDDERISFYLTNTLDDQELEQSRLPGFSSLAEESRLAGVIKKKTPVLVILGNPPYSGQSSNTGTWIRGLIEEYKKVDGHTLGEKNPKWLQDDYVKFLRFSQWKIEAASCGVVGMITNHGYLDNPTFRGMRQSLMRTFDAIYVLDLHGNTLKREACPDGGKDENVFDIRQGVAIIFLIKRGEKNKGKHSIAHSELWGLREKKYSWLAGHDVKKTRWEKLAPGSPSYLLVPHDADLESGYRKFVSVPVLFPTNSVGIVTARDGLAIRRTPEEIWKTVTVFSRLEPELAREGFELGKDARDWKVTLAQKDLLDSGLARDKIVPILYRPFDVRYTYYTGHSRGFICMPRQEVMNNMLSGENLAVIVPKRVEHVGTWQHALLSNYISDHVAVSLKTIDYHFPLYLHPDKERKDLFSHREPKERRPNLNSDLINVLEKTYKRRLSPEEIFHYVYAILFAPGYRKKYVEFLRMDFPRVPFTAVEKLFTKLADVGSQLTELHLFRSPKLETPECRFEGSGDNRVEKSRKKGLRYDAKGKRVYINSSQYFGPVNADVWEYLVGGYQVCEKWLKDRHDRRLELNDICIYCRIVTALKQTIVLQQELDTLYAKLETNLISFE